MSTNKLHERIYAPYGVQDELLAPLAPAERQQLTRLVTRILTHLANRHEALVPALLAAGPQRCQRTTEAASTATRVPPPGWPGVPSERTSSTWVVERLSPLRT
jgi:hypothetical protein